MNKLYQTFGAGDLRSSASKAFKMAESGPVVVLSRTVPKVVMVSPEMWDRTATELTRLRRIVKMDTIVADMEAGNYVTEEDLQATI